MTTAVTTAVRVPTIQPLTPTKAWFDAVDANPFHQRFLSGPPRLRPLTSLPYRISADAAAAMVWLTSPGAMACRRRVSCSLDAPAGRRQPPGSTNPRRMAAKASH
jgi:hypothetical protein